MLRPVGAAIAMMGILGARAAAKPPATPGELPLDLRGLPPLAPEYHQQGPAVAPGTFVPAPAVAPGGEQAMRGYAGSTELFPGSVGAGRAADRREPRQNVPIVAETGAPQRGEPLAALPREVP